jgi:hypothetical protein
MYGNTADQWALVTVAADAQPMPDTFAGMTLLGTVQDVLLTLAERHRNAVGNRRTQFQRKMSTRLGVGQQAVSTLMRGLHNVRPTNDGLAYLARTFCTPIDDGTASDDG